MMQSKKEVEQFNDLIEKKGKKDFLSEQCAQLIYAHNSQLQEMDMNFRPGLLFRGNVHLYWIRYNLTVSPEKVKYKGND